MQRVGRCVIIGLIGSLLGCTTTGTSNTARTGLEQMLISNAADQALERIDLSPLSRNTVYVDPTYLECVDKNYILASVRHKVFATGATVTSKPEEAEIILEVRSGVVGTDIKETFLGIPEMTIPVPPVTIPRVPFLTRSTQTGTVKLGLVAYDAKTNQAISDGGLTLARSDENNWAILGLSTLQSGSVRQELADAGVGEFDSVADVARSVARKKPESNPPPKRLLRR